MHLRNPYRVPPDFQELAAAYPLLKPFVYINSHSLPSINFKDAAAQRYLTEALLHRDFGLRITLPPNRLCPAIPNRLNYILWLQDVMMVSPPNPSRPYIQGIDIGTGASAVYPLLACRLSENWRFIGTDIDDLSLQTARQNVERNGLSNRLQVVQVQPTGALIEELFKDPSFVCDFVMCNPPFYSSVEDVQKSAEGKEFDPSAVCTGADVEMITEGGEAGFISRLVKESLRLCERCRWYTSLTGKLSTIGTIVDLLKVNGVDNYGITEFVQGQTRRWAVIWSFTNERLPDTMVRITSSTIHPYLPLPNNLRQRFPSTKTIEALLARLQEAVGALDGVVMQEVLAPALGVTQVFKIQATQNTWSRAARRRKFAGQDPIVADNELMECFIRWGTTDEDEEDLYLEASWSKGRDRTMFESFWAHVTRKLTVKIEEST